MTDTRPHTNPVGTRLRPTAMFLGLALAVIATVAPLVDLATADTTWDHVRDAYPTWSDALVRGDRNAIVLWLVITGTLGVLTWLWTIYAVTARKRWALRATVTAFVAGTSVALANLTMPGGQYDIIVPPVLGWLTLLPCLAGLAAVVSIRRHA